MEKLKPCPFCGGEAQIVVDDETENYFGVKCFNCGGAIYAEKELPRYAIEAWNKRSYEKHGNWKFSISNFGIDENATCSHCGAEFPRVPASMEYRYCPKCGAQMNESFIF